VNEWRRLSLRAQLPLQAGILAAHAHSTAPGLRTDSAQSALTRRTLIAGAAAMAAVGAGQSIAGAADAPAAMHWRIPADFEPARAIWLGFDAGHADLTAALVEALQPHVALRFLAQDDAAAQAARTLLRERGLRTEGVEFHADPLALYFMRDAAVFALHDDGSLGLVDFRWSYYGLPGWCRTRHAADAERMADCIASTETGRNGLDRAMGRRLNARAFASNLFMEGGGIESNGRGLIIANEALVRQRNPGLPREEMERMHLALPGVRKMIWLAEGLAQDPLHRATIVGQHVGWGTGGHTDEFVRFADARTVLLAWPDDAEVAVHPVARLNRQRMQRNADILARATDTEGAPLRILKVPMPRVIERRVFLSAAANVAWSKEWTADFFPPHENRREGDAVMQVACASYLNYVVANGTVVVPGYTQHGTAQAVQQRVQRIFESAFPGRQIRFIDAIGANWVGGGLHCATLNEPRGSA
jgi:agmatine deiminase